MSEESIDAQLTTLLRARPELRLASPYLGDPHGVAQLALAAISRQWIEAVYAISEPMVAASKLDWWLQELAAAREGHTHHPLAAALFAAPQAQALDPTDWQRARGAGLALRDCPPARDLDAQIAVAESFHGALAKLAVNLSHGAEANASRAARLASLGHLLSSLLQLGHSKSDNDGLPMQLLARHGLDRHALAAPGDGRTTAMRDQLRDLQKALAVAMSLPGPLDMPTAISAAADRSQLRRAVRARDPLAVLGDGRSRLGPRMAFKAWRLARQRQAASFDNNTEQS